MDYAELAEELLNNMFMFHKTKSQKNIAEALQGEAFVLSYIAFHSNGVLPGDISCEMNVSSARIAAVLNNLEKKGLITRQINKNDRRKILVKVTEQGKLLAENHHKGLLGITAKTLELLGERDAAEYVRITGRLAEITPNINISDLKGVNEECYN